MSRSSINPWYSNLPIQDWCAAYFFGSGLIESLLIFGYLALIPADPKNQWILGFSQARILFFALIGGVFLVQLPFLRKVFAGHQYFPELLDSFLTGGRLFGISFLALSSVLIFLPGAYLLFELDRFRDILVRLGPVLGLLGIRILQFIIVASWHYSKRLLRSLIPKFIALSLSLIFLILLLANIWTFSLKKLIWNDFYFSLVQEYFLLFNFDREFNIPAYFSAVLLALAGFLLFWIARNLRKQKGKYIRRWVFLGLIFLYLAIDEVWLLHEKFAEPMDRIFKPDGVLAFFPWVIGFAPFLIFLGIFYARFIFDLPKPSRNLLIISAIIYLLGAIGLELSGGWYTLAFGVNKDVRFILYSFEESFEMTGIILFIYTLLKHGQGYPINKSESGSTTSGGMGG